MAETSATLCFKWLLHKSGTVIDLTLILALSSTKNDDRLRDPEIHQTTKEIHRYVGIKNHIGVDAGSGFVHTSVRTAANVHDVTPVLELLLGEESAVFTDSGYGCERKRQEANELQVNCHITMLPSKFRTMNLETAAAQVHNAGEIANAGIRT